MLVSDSLLNICQNQAYLVNARSYKGIISEVATDIGCYHLAVDAIARNKVLVLSVGGGRRGLTRSRWSRSHLVNVVWAGRIIDDDEEGTC
jgi:hypothetical protein